MTEYAQKNNLDIAPVEKVNGKIISSKEIKSPSSRCISFIAEYEAFSAKPYRGQDSQNRTIGYGHVISSEDGAKYDNGISKEDALILLEKDVQKAVRQLNKFLESNDISLSQNQYDSLISFTFNCGSSWMNKSALKNALINRNIDKVKDAIMKWIYVNGIKSNGLINRRTDEVEMFYDADYARNY